MDPGYLRYLERIDPDDLSTRVSAFWDEPPIAEKEATLRFLEVVSSAEVDGGQASSYMMKTQTWPQRQTMWRVRRVTPPTTGAVITDMNVEADVWEAPSHFVRARGRVNTIGESVLYTSIGDPVVAMIEARVPPGEKFALVRYETTRTVRLTSIAGEFDPDLIPEHLRPAHLAVTAFYRDVFTREFDGRNDLTYMLSDKVAKDWFDLPPDASDGWSFPSIARGRGINAAFRPARAHEVLRVAGVAYCEGADSALLGPRISAQFFSPGPEAGERDFRWYPMKSPFQEEVFPEFR